MSDSEIYKEAQDGVMPSSMPMGFKDVQERAMAFAKDNGESAFTFAEKISNARTFQDLITHQTQFAQDRMQTFGEDTGALRLIGETIQK